MENHPGKRTDKDSNQGDQNDDAQVQFGQRQRREHWWTTVNLPKSPRHQHCYGLANHDQAQKRRLVHAIQSAPKSIPQFS